MKLHVRDARSRQGIPNDLAEPGYRMDLPPINPPIEAHHRHPQEITPLAIQPDRTFAEGHLLAIYQQSNAHIRMIEDPVLSKIAADQRTPDPQQRQAMTWDRSQVWRDRSASHGRDEQLYAIDVVLQRRVKLQNTADVEQPFRLLHALCQAQFRLILVAGEQYGVKDVVEALGSLAK
jgi:hypothetical protein